MCCMTSFCFCLSLRAGLFLTSILEAIFAVIEIILFATECVMLRTQNAETALILAFISVLITASILAMLGSIQEETITVILHTMFLAIALFIDLFLEIIIFGFSYFSYKQDWLIVYKVLEYCVLIYLYPVSVSYVAQLRKDQLRVSIPLPRQRLLSSAMSSEVYGL